MMVAIRELDKLVDISLGWVIITVGAENGNRELGRKMAKYSFISTVAVLYRQKVMASCRSAFDSY
jgi:hypothetical protein